MERPAEQPYIQTEQAKSFDTLASVDMYRFDLQRFNQILPETEQRVFDEELTYIAEGINRPLNTEFSLKEVDDELVFFDRGAWRPYISTLIRGLEAAKQEALADPRKQFLVQLAAENLQQGYQMNSLKPGEQIAWKSGYPEREEFMYGKQFMSELGLQPNRKMGFLYLATRELDGSLTLQTQSVDNSDEDAFAAAMLLGKESKTDMDALRTMYDRVLSKMHGREFYAGRDTALNMPAENAWEVVRLHTDLLEYYFSEIAGLAANMNMSRPELEVAKKRLTYGVWAALKERLDSSVYSTPRNLAGTGLFASQELLRHEISLAYQKASARGEVLFGCGGALKGEDAILDASSEDVFDSIFGNKKENWKWSTGICRVDGCPTRPGKTKVGPCKVCTCCQNLFDKGKDPAQEYKLRPSKAKYN